jgi:hypothetical protein
LIIIKIRGRVEMNKFNKIVNKKISGMDITEFDFMLKRLDKKIYLKDTINKEIILINTFNDLIKCLMILKYKYTMEQDIDGVMIEFEIGDGKITLISDIIDFNIIDYRY